MSIVNISLNASCSWGTVDFAVLSRVPVDRYLCYHQEKIPFDYHYHRDDDSVQDFKQGNLVLSVKYFQHVLNKYDNPKVDDLIICELPDRSLQFRVVQAVPRSYFYEASSETEYYVPQGFVVLYDPLSKESKMVRRC